MEPDSEICVIVTICVVVGCGIIRILSESHPDRVFSSPVTTVILLMPITSSDVDEAAK